jgi:hypothetical protein
MGLFKLMGIECKGHITPTTGTPVIQAQLNNVVPARYIPRSYPSATLVAGRVTSSSRSLGAM